MRRRANILALALLALPLAAAPAARADAFDRIFHEYQQHGTITACKYTPAQLKQAQGEVPNDVEAYAPDFPDALENAIEQRAAGGCSSGGQPATQPQSAAPTPAAPSATTPAAPAAGAPATTNTPAPPANPTAAPAASDQAIVNAARTADRSDAGTTAPVVALAVLGVLLLIGGLLYGIAHWLALDPLWARRGRHALAEAGWRSQGAWSEFADWLRLGR